MSRLSLNLGTIAIVFVIAIGVSYAYAQTDEIDVGFEWDFKDCIESSVVTTEGAFQRLDCSWLGGLPEGADVIRDPDDGFKIITEEEVVPEEEPEVIVEEVTIPKTPAEKMIDELIIKMEKDGFLPSHEGQLLMALLSLQEECELGTLEGAPIQTYKLFHVATFEPYTHTDLGTQYILKEIEMAIQECKAQKILREKVLGDQYLHLPGVSDVTPPHVFRDNFEGLIWDELVGLENPTYAFEERHMTEYNKDKSIQFAEEFKCSAIGKSMGHCRDPFGGADPEEDVVTMSSQGKELLSKYKAYQETGETAIPQKDMEREPDLTFALDQYIASYGITDEQLKEWYESRQP